MGEAGAQDQVTALLARDPAAHAALDDPGGVANLLGSLREAGAQDQVTALAARAAAHTPLDRPYDAARLLAERMKAGAQDQVTALAARPAALGSPYDAARLLAEMRKAGAQDQVALLVDKLPDEGLFDLFCAQGNNNALYRFGREPDGSPARSWGWDDLN